MEHWLFSWLRQWPAVSTPALVREERRSWQLGWLGTLLGPEDTGAACSSGSQTGIASYRLSHSLLVGGLGLVAVWVLGLFVF